MQWTVDAHGRICQEEQRGCQVLQGNLNLVLRLLQTFGSITRICLGDVTEAKESYWVLGSRLGLRYSYRHPHERKHWREPEVLVNTILLAA